MKKKCCLALVLILLVSIGVTISAQEVSKKAVKLVNKGDEALLKKDFGKALEAYDKAIEEAPNYALAYFGKGRAYQAQNNLEEAVKNLEKAVELDGEAPQPKNFLAQTLFQMGGEAFKQRQLELASGYYLKMLEIPGVSTAQPELTPKALYQVATIYFMMRKVEEANQYYQKVLNLPGIDTADKLMQIQATYQVGTTFSAMKQHDKAMEYFLKLLDFPELQAEYNTLYLSTLYMVGLNANFANNMEKSAEYLAKFIEEAKDSADHAQFMPLANLLLGSGKMTQLQEEAAKIKDKDKVDKVAELAKAKPEIETYLNKAIELKPELEPAYMHLGNYYYYCNDLEKAIATYKTLIEKFPTSPDMEQYKKFLADIEKEAQAEKK